MFKVHQRIYGTFHLSWTCSFFLKKDKGEIHVRTWEGYRSAAFKLTATLEELTSFHFGEQLNKCSGTCIDDRIFLTYRDNMCHL